MLASIQLLKLLADIAGGDGEVRAVARDDLLPFAAEDEAEELAYFRVQRAAGGLVDVDVRVARQRVAAVGDVVRRERNGGAVPPAAACDDPVVWLGRGFCTCTGRARCVSSDHSSPPASR